MTVIVGGYTAFERQILAAAYYVSNQSGQDRISINEIVDRYEIDVQPRWIRTAITNFREVGWSKERLHNGPLSDQRVWLTADGIKEAERIIEGEPNGFLVERLGKLAYRPSDFREKNAGRSSIGRLGEAERVKLLTSLQMAEQHLDDLKLGNLERSQALSYIVAMRVLAESPEPPADLIWELATRANNIAGVAALFISIIGLFS